MAASRMRLRDAEESQAAPAASPPVAVVTGTAPARSPPSRGAAGSAMREPGLGLEEEGRRRSQKGKKTKKRDKDNDSKQKATAGGGNGKEQRRRKSGENGAVESAGGRNGSAWDQPTSAPLAWAPADGTKGRQGQDEFRAPGELGDDFFGDSGSDSGSDSSGAAVSALTAYARLDPTTAATTLPRAFAPPAVAAAPAPASTYAAGYAAPRRMEGFGGGRSAPRGMGPGAPSGSGPGSAARAAQPPVQPRCGCDRVWGVERCEKSFKLACGWLRHCPLWCYNSSRFLGLDPHPLSLE